MTINPVVQVGNVVQLICGDCEKQCRSRNTVDGKSCTCTLFKVTNVYNPRLMATTCNRCKSPATLDARPANSGFIAKYEH